MVEPFAKPTQFALKHALAVLAIVAVWSAVMRQPHLRAYGDIATLLVLIYYSRTMLITVGSWIRGFAERGFPCAISGLVAATIGSLAALAYGTLLIDANSNGEAADFVPNLMWLLGGLAYVVFWLMGLVIVLSLVLLTFADLFRRPLRSFPLIFAYNLLSGTVGAGIFVLASMVIAVVSSDAVRRESMIVIGGAIGFAFGSCGLHVHLDYADDCRIREDPGLLQESRYFES